MRFKFVALFLPIAVIACAQSNTTKQTQKQHQAVSKDVYDVMVLAQTLDVAETDIDSAILDYPSVTFSECFMKARIRFELIDDQAIAYLACKKRHPEPATED